MAAIFQIRRGSGSVSLEDGELYVNKGPDSLQYAVGDREITLAKLDELNTGSLYLKGGISASGDITASNIYVSGNVVLGGTITIGDNSSDNVVVNADLSSSIIPNNDNAFDLGSASYRYKDIYGVNIYGAIKATNGVVSGSSQITYTSISSIPAGIVSGSTQVITLLPTGTISGSIQVLGGTGIVSGSSQITYANISSIPTGIVSGSSQITYASISSIPSGIVSGSSQVLGGSGVASGSYETTGRSIVSSSAQIIPLLPAGVVSGSSQVITSNAITLGTHTTGNYVATITGTANQITVAGSGLETAAITLSTPQDIHTSATPQFSSLGIGTAASGVGGEIRATGDVTAFYSSDIRLKENIFPIRNALQKVNEISGNTYDWKEGFEEIHSHKGNDVGVIAQEIEIILPEIVTNRDNGFKAVQYEKIIPLLIEAIKELSLKVKELENK